MKLACPRIVVAATGSGAGKTSLAVGLARLLTRRGLRVQTFKVGPDFLDPTYLALASGRPCYNLDGWMTSQRYTEELFTQASAEADIAVIEGVMGLFDGASPRGLEGSTAEIAAWLEAPVVLVVPVHGVAQSLAATVLGFTRFHPAVRVAGVIGNRGGSPRHHRWLAESLAGAAAPPLVGTVPRESLPELPSRHLGLVTADQAGFGPSVLDQLADACGCYLDVDQLLELARSAPPLELDVRRDEPASHPRRVRVGIAQDEAFHFYYPDNLDALRRHGAELVPFSPLNDHGLPSGLDAVYFGGGYPELYAARLAENVAMLAEVHQFADAGQCLYAECGGLMYLGRSITTLEGCRYPMAGVLPLDTAMLPKLKVLGYAEVAWTADSPWGHAGQRMRGHEFHYSEIVADDGPTHGWQPAYTARRRHAASVPGGFANRNVLAGYVHLHWASKPDAVDCFLAHCGSHS